MTSSRPKILVFFLAILTMHVFTGQMPLMAEEAGADLEALLQEARGAHRAGDYPSAISAYEQANALHDQDSKECLASLGWLYTETGQLPKAVDAYERLFQLSAGKSFDHLMKLTSIYDRTGKSAEAIDACRQFIEHADQEPLLARAHNELGYRLVSEDDSPEALQQAAAAFAEALALSKDKADNARLNLAEIRLRQGLREEGLELLSSLASESEAKTWRDLRRLDVRPEIVQAADVIREQRRRNPRAQARVVASATPGKGDGQVSKPEKIYSPQAPYTEEARQARIQGVVILQAVIDENGRVTEIKVLKGLPMGLSESAVETLRTWEFQPATLDGKPIAVHYNLTMNFRLPERR